VQNDKGQSEGNLDIECVYEIEGEEAPKQEETTKQEEITKQEETTTTITTTKSEKSETKKSEVGVIKFVLHSGKILEKQDVTSAGDPFVHLTYGKEERKTKVVHNTLTPEWNQGVCCMFVI
jgi:hypothetical protein